ncbi:universal stress protein [Tenacibaculum aestuariivivum]|uniref:universal stress protein n=1 Tax=Tenacibaculum aestuariivivum TaxID=2006131 RepID=UPI003AB19C75
MKNILIPYDFSETAINALNYTKKLFKGTNVSIHLLDVYITEKSHLVSEEKSDNWYNEMDNEIEEESKYLLDILTKEDTTFKYNFIIDSTSLTNAIKKVVSEKSIDLIISGTKGAKSLTETFIGTNTLKIINTINNCPILIVPTTYKYKFFDKIVFSTNYKRSFKRDELKILLQLSILKKCTIEIVNYSEEYTLNDKQRSYKVQLREIFKNLSVTYKKLDWNDSETNTLKSHLEKTACELFSLINHKNNFFNSLLEENVVKKAAFHSKVPFIILPEL